MKIFVVDECNITWDQEVSFYFYGGIVVPEENIKELTEHLIRVKKVNGINLNRPIKWSNNKWKKEAQLDNEVHKKIKEEILSVFARSDCKIIVCLSPQKFYHKLKLDKSGKPYQAIDADTQNRTHRYAISDTLFNFNLMLKESKDTGIVFADEFSQSSKTHLTDHCLDIFNKKNHEHILHPVIQLKNEDSPLNQINDVVLGAIYFSLREMGYNFLPIISNNFWGSSKNPQSIISKGFTVLPALPQYEWCKLAKKKIMDKFLRRVNV